MCKISFSVVPGKVFYKAIMGTGEKPRKCTKLGRVSLRKSNIGFLNPKEFEDDFAFLY